MNGLQILCLLIAFGLTIWVCTPAGRRWLDGGRPHSHIVDRSEPDAAP